MVFKLNIQIWRQTCHVLNLLNMLQCMICMNIYIYIYIIIPCRQSTSFDLYIYIYLYIICIRPEYLFDLYMLALFSICFSSFHNFHFSPYLNFLLFWSLPLSHLQKTLDIKTLIIISHVGVFHKWMMICTKMTTSLKI